MPKEKTTRKAAPKKTEKKKKGKFGSRAPTLLPPCSPVTDPNAPKRGLSAYMFFANEQREKVREDNPGIKFGKLMLVNPSSALFSNLFA